MSNRDYLKMFGGLLAGFLVLTFLVVSGATQNFDVALVEFVYEFRSDFLTTFFHAISLIASELGAAIITLTIALVLVVKKKYAYAIFLTIANGGVFIVNTIIKNIVERPRPGISPLETTDSFSYPSGHSAEAMVMFISIVFVIAMLYRSCLKPALIVGTTLLVLTGISRIYLGMHYLTDVLGGFFVGAMWALTCIFVFKKLQSKARQINH